MNVGIDSASVNSIVTNLYWSKMVFAFRVNPNVVVRGGRPKCFIAFISQHSNRIILSLKLKTQTKTIQFKLM